MYSRSTQLLLLLCLASAQGISQTFTAPPSVIANADGRLEIFARGSDGAAWHNWQNTPGGAWVGWYSLGGYIAGSPNATINADGRLDVFVLGGGNIAYHNYQTSPGGGWSGWISLGGSITSAPKVATNADGRLEIFARGTDGGGWHAWQQIPGNNWSGWLSFGGGIADSPSGVQNADGRLEIFALGGNTAYHNTQLSPGGAWSGWVSLGGSIVSTPTADLNFDGRVEIFAQGTDNAGWHAWQSTPGTSWTGWSSFGGGISGSPSAQLNGQGELQIVALGGTAAYLNWQVSPGGGWSGWNGIGGSLSGVPVLAVNFDGRLETFGLWQDGTIYHDWEISAGSSWYGWQPLSQPSNSGATNGADTTYLWTEAQNDSNFAAKKNACSPPPWWTPAAAWPCGSRVNIAIAGYKDQKPFQTAKDNWNAQLLSFFAPTGGVPVQLFISAGGPQAISVYKVGNNNIPANPPQANHFGRAQNTNHVQDATGRLLRTDIQIISGMTFKPTLANTFAHELGHTFGLGDCPGCSRDGTPNTAFNVMDTGENFPGAHVWGDYVSMNFTEGLNGPTQCDIQEISAKLPDYAGACIQAQSTPPDQPSCTNGSAVGFTDTGGSSSEYTCGGSPCTGCNSSCNNFAPNPCPDSGGSGGGTTCSQWCGTVCMDTATCSCPGESPTCEENSGGYFPNCNNSCTPVVLDPFGEGFHFSDVADGVKFRVAPNAKLRQMSWPDAAFHNGWLALDRNGNGTIDDFSELFGGSTPQPPSADRNGYLALAVFDDPNNGGNGNRAIDPGDSVYAHLRVWIDENHNGISEPGELHTLSELGIFQIDLEYFPSKYKDENGNVFRYRSQVKDLAGQKHDMCYDVYVEMK